MQTNVERERETDIDRRGKSTKKRRMKNVTDEKTEKFLIAIIKDIDL